MQNQGRARCHSLRVDPGGCIYGCPRPENSRRTSPSPVAVRMIAVSDSVRVGNRRLAAWREPRSSHQDRQPASRLRAPPPRSAACAACAMPLPSPRAEVTLPGCGPSTSPRSGTGQLHGHRRRGFALLFECGGRNRRRQAHAQQKRTLRPRARGIELHDQIG